MTMPNTGERNDQFGMYVSNCCGSEIVIASGAVFPVCPKHCKATGWINLESSERCLEEEAA
jgi:hypothetical protein